MNGDHMASSSSALVRFQSACVICVRGGQRAVLRYRDFLLDPGTLFTLVSLLLLIAATIQGIRERDFTADIPVSFATAAALIIGQYSAAAVVAVLLLLGGMLEEFVS